MKNELFDLEVKKLGIKTNHILHLLLSIFTGVWVFVWIFIVFRNQSKIKDIDNQIKIIELKEKYLDK